jgi:phage tail-like protein
MEIGGKHVGYLKSVELPKLTADVVENPLGPANRTKKHLAKMSWKEITVEMGVGMSADMYAWMNASFQNSFERRSGAIMLLDHDYKVVRRCDFTDAQLTEVTMPAFDAKGKDALYFTLKMQPETVRYSAGGGTVQPEIAAVQKLYANTMFQADFGGLPANNLVKVDSVKWECKATEDAVGPHVESRYAPTAVKVNDLKVTINAVDEAAWYDKFFAFMVSGQREESHELSCSVNILDAARNPIAELKYDNCGPKEFGHPKKTANEDKISQIECTFYVESIQLNLMKKS